ncbi:hypothetical protein NG895_29030 [Aeoliella sp. ICT_H6.2]|uniref:Uncharacterized protein n=1 Tax=Aeoliella straminimaris TaxID=2954799 RepID=A0A9X2JJJ6_9BACT|nr:hypothetical protein [Aeoliella straminimaris]MCO6047966.1 hypothetical protein [Aeoliella straminimaris]
MSNSSTCPTASSSSLLALSGHALPAHLIAENHPATQHGVLHHLATALAAIPYAIGIFCVWLFERDEFDSSNKHHDHSTTDDQTVHRTKQPEDYDPWVVPMFWC